MTKNIFSLENKVVVVTGGYGFLGKAICLGLSEAGAKVYLTGKELDKLNEVAAEINGKNIEVLDLDIRYSSSIQKGIESIWEKEKRVDVLLNNAVYGKQGDALDANDSEWFLGIDGTVGGVYRATKAIIPYLEKNKCGTIINIASMYGIVSPDPSVYDENSQSSPPSYAIGKAGIIQYTRYAACHLGSRGIRVNCVSPGPFPDLSIQTSAKFIENLKKKNPLGRIGVPNDMVGIVIFLASDASSFITGQNICIDGGWTAW
jgi:Dehydrogenases with different specificities (related to short-chain alcohol dehydrogenases)